MILPTPGTIPLEFAVIEFIPRRNHCNVDNGWCANQANQFTKPRIFRTMALRDILVYPDSRLRKRATPVETVDSAVTQLIDDMAQTMYGAPGIGLAATQVNVSKRIVVIDISEAHDQLQVFINPVICGSGERVETEEGCLSVPGIVAPVSRFSQVHVTALDRHGVPFELQTEGLLAICIQHEVDHLDGKVFVDYLSQLKRDRIRKHLVRESRPEATGVARSKENTPAL